ncbi:HNHc domain containing protein [uncultured Caudovirales phage]|uniref:HNHc domain containing protein n=1 Tax=uncultured Caudovirales phage TaxID=2100421 RepID=A0A6J5MX87_9CAUD|nr:HNHc domain containing protein [uncultured Caudovirales phage]
MNARGRTQQGLCGCGNLQRNVGRNPNGVTIYGTACNSCHRTGKKSKLDHCQRCGFKGEDPVQLDVDHIDGNRSNNDPSNLQTLCANCHRLKTKQNKDWDKKK